MDWTSVKEKPPLRWPGGEETPRISVNVLVATNSAYEPDFAVACYSYEEDDWTVFADLKTHPISNVTHWMPLPEHPLGSET